MNYFINYVIYADGTEFGDNFTLTDVLHKDAMLLAETYVDNLGGEYGSELGTIQAVDDPNEWATLCKYVGPPITWDDVADQLGMESGDAALLEIRRRQREIL